MTLNDRHYHQTVFKLCVYECIKFTLDERHLVAKTASPCSTTTDDVTSRRQTPAVNVMNTRLKVRESSLPCAGHTSCNSLPPSLHGLTDNKTSKRQLFFFCFRRLITRFSGIANFFSGEQISGYRGRKSPIQSKAREGQEAKLTPL